MSTIRKDLIFAALTRAYTLIDYNTHDNIDEQHEFKKQTILADKSITKDEKLEAIKLLNEDYDYHKLLFNKGKKRTCEDCIEDCLATLYCEHCIRNFLKSEFSYWKSGNKDIDDLIQKCQMESLSPRRIVEWIPYDNLRNVKYLTEGGCSEIYTADWICGEYYEWNSKERELVRYGTEIVILKKLKNVESANRTWFDEAKSHLTITSKWDFIVKCYGLTQDPSDGSYILVMKKLDTNLREYLKQNQDKLTWKERIKITFDIIDALARIHNENAIHRDLHSGNILYNQYTNYWLISDLGFCGPVNKQLGCIYGDLPYIAPEVIYGEDYTKASDIYSLAMLMWEISSGQPPFSNYEGDYDLAMDIVNGMRPKIIPGTPLKYKELMEECWDADPTKRPDIITVMVKVKELNKLYYQNVIKNNRNFLKKFLKRYKKANKLDETSDLELMSLYCASSRLSISKTYQFDDLPEPKNATEEEQEVNLIVLVFLKRVVDDIHKSSDQNNNSTRKTNSIFKRNSKPFSKVLQKLHIGTSDDNQNNYKRKTIKQQVKKQDISVNDNDIFNDPNLHSEDQDELEIPDDIF
ncbi:hypothetical protein RclHR1_04540010 [Rhizophagus clarus]|uniref:Protein kinase domain-containing protein n=1 Tax=Rhizophagus clarus TaxID=94130 RepID=A0A2Z6RI82_9GLOM|nr:hypothetical protein RclHR1_04540010 [Rhizophagus clarus]